MDNPSTTKNGFIDFFYSNRFHFYLWGIFLIYEIGIVGLYTGSFGKPIQYIVVYGLNICLFYCHSLITLRWGIKNVKIFMLMVPSLFLIQIGVYLVLSFLSQYILINLRVIPTNFTLKFNQQFVLSTVFRALYFILFATGYYFLNNYLTQLNKAKRLEKTRLENEVQIAQSQSAYLRAQINPHFLFNTLDFIYHNARETAPVAAESISALSEMMRHAVDSNFEKKFISLGSEIEQVENLINIHQLRENHTLNIRLFYDDEARDVLIIPLVLITIVENMFKHGDLTDRKNPGRINIDIEGSDLLIETSNLTSTKKFKGSLASGMKNISKRLGFAYGTDATFTYQEQDKHIFTVKLCIKNIC